MSQWTRSLDIFISCGRKFLHHLYHETWRMKKLYSSHQNHHHHCWVFLFFKKLEIESNCHFSRNSLASYSHSQSLSTALNENDLWALLTLHGIHASENFVIRHVLPGFVERILWIFTASAHPTNGEFWLIFMSYLAEFQLMNDVSSRLHIKLDILQDSQRINIINGIINHVKIWSKEILSDFHKSKDNFLERDTFLLRLLETIFHPFSHFLKLFAIKTS